MGEIIRRGTVSSTQKPEFRHCRDRGRGQPGRVRVGREAGPVVEGPEGVRICAGDEVRPLLRADAVEVRSGDVDLPGLLRALAELGVPTRFTGGCIAAQDHGFNPSGSNRVFRFEIWERALAARTPLEELFYAADEVPPELTRLFLRSGRWLAPGGRGEVLVGEAFAAANQLKPGDTIAMLLNGRRQQLRIAGVILDQQYANRSFAHGHNSSDAPRHKAPPGALKSSGAPVARNTTLSS